MGPPAGFGPPAWVGRPAADVARVVDLVFVADEDGDDRLSPAEALFCYRAKFAEIDANGDGASAARKPASTRARPWTKASNPACRAHPAPVDSCRFPTPSATIMRDAR
jgi:hypothetical protein